MLYSPSYYFSYQSPHRSSSNHADYPNPIFGYYRYGSVIAHYLLRVQAPPSYHPTFMKTLQDTIACWDFSRTFQIDPSAIEFFSQLLYIDSVTII